MGKPRINVTDQWIQQNVLANPGVRKALNATARRLLPIAKRIAYKEHAPTTRTACASRPAPVPARNRPPASNAPTRA